MRNRSHKSKFTPRNPAKYKGDPTAIIARSSWERHLFIYCDTNKNIIQWSSEEVVIPYLDPTSKNLDGSLKARRYFPDLWMRVKDANGNVKEYILEIKPKYQTVAPERKRGKSRVALIEEALTYAKNKAKWEAAEIYCSRRNITFKIATEENIFGKKS